MTILWTDDLATGVDEIDEQHRELYRQISALHAAMKAGSLQQVRDVVEYLRRYAVDHFATEEGAMRALGYPGFDVHRRAHCTFVAQYERLAERATERISPGVAVDLSSWLGEWLREHVRRIDRELAIHLRASGAAGAVPRPRR